MARSSRAGRQTTAECFDELSNAIEQVQMRPGRNVKPVDMAVTAGGRPR